MDRPLHEGIAAARHSLVVAGLPPEDAALDAEVLARQVLGWDRATLLTRATDPPPSGFDDAFDPLIKRRAAREPVAYITGHREFWGLAEGGGILVTVGGLGAAPGTPMERPTIATSINGGSPPGLVGW